MANEMELAPASPLPSAELGWSGAKTDGRLVELWLAQKQSENTRRAYQRDITEFFAVVGRPLSAVTLADLQNYQAYLQERGLRASSVQRKVKAIKSLLGFAVQTGYLRWDVGRAWKAPKAPVRTAERILPEAKALQVVMAPENKRDRALLGFLYATGLRVSEVASLTWDSLRPTEDGGGVLTVYGKGGKTRFLRLSPRRVTELTEVNPQRKGPLFANPRTGAPLSVRQIRQIVAKAAEKALGQKGISPHWLRHCAATHSLRRGIPLSELMATMGHSSLEVTSRYLHANPNTCLEDYLPDW